MKISIVGWYGEKNLGDEAFRQVFEEQWSSHELSFGKKPDLSADVIVYGGGGVACGSYLDLLPPDRKAYALGVDIAVNGAAWSRLQSFQGLTLYCRSREYSELAGCFYMPDLAWGLEPIRVRQVPGRIGVILTDELPGHLFDNVKLALETSPVVQECVLIPLYSGVSSDLKAMRKLDLSIPHEIYQSGTVDQAREQIARCELLITMRFHGAVFAAQSGVPYISLARPGKHSLFAEQEGWRELFHDVRDLSHPKLREHISLVHRDSYRLHKRMMRVAQTNRRHVLAQLQTVLPITD